MGNRPNEEREEPQAQLQARVGGFAENEAREERSEREEGTITEEVTEERGGLLRWLLGAKKKKRKVEKKFSSQEKSRKRRRLIIRFSIVVGAIAVVSGVWALRPKNEKDPLPPVAGPIARLHVSRVAGQVPFAVRADASASESRAGEALAFRWFLDTLVLPATTATTEVRIDAPGRHVIRVMVRDSTGESDASAAVDAGEAVVPFPPEERVLEVSCYVRTGTENKELGGWHIRVSQDGRDFFDGTWGFGENWDNHSEKRFTSPLDHGLTGGLLTVTSTLEEREGEVRIDWGIELMRIVLRTNLREIVFERGDFVHKSRGDGGRLKQLDIPRSRGG